MDERGLKHMLETSIEVAARLDELSQTGSPVDGKYRKFAIEVNAFTGAWSILERAFQDPRSGFTGNLLHMLNRITHDCEVIFNRLETSVRTLDVQYRNRKAYVRQKLFSFTGYSKTRQYEPLRLFFDNESILLHRAQIVFATSIINIVIAVIQHSRVGQFGQSKELREQLDGRLIDDQIESRALVKSLEEVNTTTTPRALHWFGRLDDQPGPASDLIQTLSTHWVIRRHTAPHDSHGHNARQSDELEAYRAQLAADFNRRFAEHEQRSEQRSRDLEARLHAVEQTYAQDVAQIEILQTNVTTLQTRIAELEEQSKADQEDIEYLEERCRRWKTKSDRQKGRIAELEAATNPVVVNQLEQLKRQVAQQLKSLATLERRNEELHRNNSSLEIARQTSMSSLREKERNIQVLQVEIENVTADRQNWRRRAEQLEEQIPMGPTAWRARPMKFRSGSDSGYSTNDNT